MELNRVRSVQDFITYVDEQKFPRRSIYLVKGKANRIYFHVHISEYSNGEVIKYLFFTDGGNIYSWLEEQEMYYADGKTPQGIRVVWYAPRRS